MNVKITAIVILLIGVSFFCLAQNIQAIDSLHKALEKAPQDSTKVEILVELWRTTAYNNPTLGVKYSREIIAESKKINFETGIATGYQRLGIAQSFLGQRDSVVKNYRKALSIYERLNSKGLQGVMLFNIGLEFQDKAAYDSALFYIKQAGDLFIQEGDRSRLAAVLQGIGGIEQERGNYRISLQKFLAASELFSQYGDSLRLGDSYINIGDSYDLIKEYNSAIQYYQKSIKIATSLNDQRSVAIALIKLGDTYSNLLQYDSAILLLERSVALTKKLQSPFLTTEAISSLALCYYQQGKYDQALPLFQEGLQMSIQTEYNLFKAANYINIGWTQYHQNQLLAAENNAKKGLQVAKETQTKENIKSALELLSEIKAKQGDYKEALAFHKEFKQLNDSIYNTTKSGTIAELQTLYETEKKENEIALQKEEIIILNQEAKIEALKTTLLSAGLIAVLIIGGLIIFGVYQKMKRVKLVQEQEKQNFETELNHSKKQLTTHTLHLVQKNELLSDLKSRITEIKKNSSENKAELNRLLQLIKSDHQADNDWENFKMYFEQVHEDFDAKLREQINDLTNNEMRLAALMKMNLTSKEIASIMNISPDSVNKARYRLRKKLNLSGDDSLHSFLLAL
jgi:tetratricopeptide (TPR) repeat protein